VMRTVAYIRAPKFFLRFEYKTDRHAMRLDDASFTAAVLSLGHVEYVNAFGDVL